MTDTGQDTGRFWDMPQRDLLTLLQATPAGLTSEEAKTAAASTRRNSLVRGNPASLP